VKISPTIPKSATENMVVSPCSLIAPYDSVTTEGIKNPKTLPLGFSYPYDLLAHKQAVPEVYST
jgi:hypothetical protein